VEASFTTGEELPARSLPSGFLDQLARRRARLALIGPGHLIDEEDTCGIVVGAHQWQPTSEMRITSAVLAGPL
jgi:hypothetical protein